MPLHINLEVASAQSALQNILKCNCVVFFKQLLELHCASKILKYFPANSKQRYTRNILKFSFTHFFESYWYNILVSTAHICFSTKRIPGFWNLSYAERLNRLQLQSLENRRLLSDLVLCFNIVHGLLALPLDDFFKMHNYSSTRGHSFKLIIPPSKTNRSKFFFSSRVIPVWNSLPQELISVTTSSHFKKLISSHDLTVFLSQPSYFRTGPSSH